MIRNDLQHIQLDSQKSKQEPALHKRAAFSRLKALNSSLPIQQDIENLDHLDFGAGFSI
jgi:methylmalonyl-CoA mutase